MELQSRVEELSRSGIGVAAISYDSVETLAAFAEEWDIKYPLLSDDDSAAIKAFGILNTVAEEGLGPDGDDPDVAADVYTYVAASGAGEFAVGTPYPGTFIVDHDGRVTARFFEDFYRERNTTSNVMLKLGMEVEPVEAVEGSTSHLSFTAYPSNREVFFGSRFSIAVDVEPKDNMHVYAPGAEDFKYRVVKLDLEPNDAVSFEPVKYPESEIYHFEPLDEHVPVYMQPFTLVQEVVVDASDGAWDGWEALENLTLKGALNYQACDDEICYLAQSVPLSFTIEIAGRE